MKYSLTYTGLIVILLSVIADKWGMKASESDIEAAVLTLAPFVGILISLYGRFRAGGINVLGLRKK